MNTVVLTVAIIVAVAIAMWAFGSIVLRVCGAVALLDGIGGIIFRGGVLTHFSYVELGVGLVLWMAGHWLFAMKYKAWRSSIGRAPWKLPVLSTLAPIDVR